MSRSALAVAPALTVAQISLMGRKTVAFGNQYGTTFTHWLAREKEQYDSFLQSNYVGMKSDYDKNDFVPLYEYAKTQNINTEEKQRVFNKALEEMEHGKVLSSETLEAMRWSQSKLVERMLRRDYSNASFAGHKEDVNLLYEFAKNNRDDKEQQGVLREAYENYHEGGGTLDDYHREKLKQPPRRG